MNKKAQSDLGGVIFIIILVLAFIGLCMWIFPTYNVWSQEMSGKADLAEAEWSKQIMIEEARAEKDAASLRKSTDIIRAEGIAEANRIISQSLTDKYIKWKWVEGLHDGSSEVIYIATEAGIPILEARG